MLMESVSIKNLDLNFGSVEVLKNLNLDVHQGEFIVLLGSSGCGKSTLLNCIAGLLDVSDGQIFINGNNVTWHEPSERGIGMVFQSYALYPQMTVEGNLSFGLRNAGVAKAEIQKKVARAAEILQIEALLKRKPSELSGGQRQRVAIGRALVRDVDVFLFDEPLSNLDAKLRTDLRVEIKRLHQQLKNTMIYVTHDQIEAMTLADRIAIMREGKIMQLASPAEIYGRPVNKYVADFIGSPAMNFLEGRVEKGAFHFDGGVLPLDQYDFSEGMDGDRDAWIGIRPEHVLVAEGLAKADLTVSVRADIVEPMGADTLLWCEFGGQSFRIRLDGQFEIKEGDMIDIGFTSNAISLFDKSSEIRL